MKFHFDRNVLYFNSRLYVKSSYVKSRVYCLSVSVGLFAAAGAEYKSGFPAAKKTEEIKKNPPQIQFQSVEGIIIFGGGRKKD